MTPLIHLVTVMNRISLVEVQLISSRATFVSQQPGPFTNRPSLGTTRLTTLSVIAYYACIIAK